MTVENNRSRQRMVRVVKAHDDHLREKAKANPTNYRNAIATEINLLIESDYKKSRKHKV